MKTKIALLIALIVILVMVMMQPTLAYYTEIGRATNVVTSGNVKLQIHETTADGSPFPTEGITVIPGDVVSKEVRVENICRHPFYLRLKLTSSSTDATIDTAGCLAVNIDTVNWTYADGYYYYNEILEPGEVTPALFTQVEIIGSKVDQTHIGASIYLNVNAQAVQSENNPAANPWSATGWPAE